MHERALITGPQQPDHRADWVGLYGPSDEAASIKTLEGVASARRKMSLAPMTTTQGCHFWCAAGVVVVINHFEFE